MRDELDGFLGCGLLCRGFAHLRCADCDERRLVAFSCKGRGFCPSCAGRRMCQTALNLRDHVLPPGVPLRQWVLTLPFELRGLLAYDAKTLGAVSRIFVDSVLGFYRRRLRASAPGGQSGAVTVVQRASSDLRLNPHFHAVFLDGVFTARHVSDDGHTWAIAPELTPAAPWDASTPTAMATPEDWSRNQLLFIGYLDGITPAGNQGGIGTYRSAVPRRASALPNNGGLGAGPYAPVRDLGVSRSYATDRAIYLATDAGLYAN